MPYIGDVKEYFATAFIMCIIIFACLLAAMWVDVGFLIPMMFIVINIIIMIGLEVDFIEKIESKW